MSSIDQRIVEMQFDNSQFERNISTSIESLDKMKESLNLDESAKSFGRLEKAGKSFSLAGVGNSVAAIANKFTAMEIVAITALQNIANSAINYGKRIISALTIQPVKTGFAEYETQIGAIQTILANTSSKGKTLEDVNNALDELNHYADMTIYNFTEMTRNIGTFTAAGVELETSVASIKGIANLAAISGSTSTQASTAMYQLSQALASGTVKLMDWNSVVNAGMGGQVFQDALKRTASVMGVTGEEATEVFRKLQNDEISFRDSLSSGWLSAEVLTQTLMQFTGDLGEAELIALGYTQEQAAEILEMGELAKSAATEVKTFTQLFDTLKEAAQSGWTQSWELIVGDFEEAKALLTGFSDYFSDIINQSAESRNAVLTQWKELGGRDLLFGENGIVWNLIHSIENVVGAFSRAFKEFFPPTTGRQLLAITQSIANFAEKVKAFTEDSAQMGKLSRGFRGVAAAVKMVAKVASGLWRVIKRIAELVGPHILDAFASIGDMVVGMNKSFNGDALFDGIIKAIETLYDVAVETIPKIANYLKSLYDSFIESDFYKNTLMPAITDIKGFVAELKARLSEFDQLDLSGVSEVWGKVKIVFGAIVDAFKTLKTKLEPYLKGIDLNSVFGAIMTVLGIILAIKLYRGIGTAQSIMTNITDAISGVGDSIGKLGDKLTEGRWTKRAKTFILLAGSIWLIGDTVYKLAQLDWEGVAKGAIGLALVIGGLILASKLIDDVKLGTGLALLGISVAVKIMADSLLDIAALSWEQLGIGITGLTFVMGELLGFVKLATTDPSLKQFSALKLIGLAAAVWIFSQSLVSLASISLEAMLIGVTGLTIILGELIGFIKLANSDPNVKSFSAVKLIVLALAVEKFANTLVLLGSMSWEQVGIGVTALTGIMIELIAFIKLANTKSGGNLADVGMLFGLGDAVKNMGEALKMLGEMSWKQVGVGLTALTAIMIELIAFVKLASSDKELKSFGSLKLMALGVTVWLFAQSLKQLSELSWDDIARSVSALTIVMAELIIFVRLATRDKGVKAFSAFKLIGLGVAVWLFAQSLKQLSELSWEGIGRAMTALTGIMAELIIFVRLATTGPGLKQFSAFKLIGLGVAVWLFAQSLKQLSSLSWSDIARATTALTVVMIELIAFVKLATRDPSVKAFSGVKLILLALAVRLFASSISVMGDMSWDAIFKGVVMLTTIMLEMIAFTRLAKDMKLSSLIAIIPMLAAMAGMAVALNFVKDLSWEQMAAFGGGLSAIVLALAGAMAILGALPLSVIVKGSAGLIIAAAALGVAVSILAKLVGNAFANFSADVYQVGANIKGYSDLVAGLNVDAINDSITVMKDLGGVAASLSLRNFSGAGTFSTALADIGGGMNLYATLVKDVTADKSAEVRTMVDDVAYISGKMNSLADGDIDVELLGTVLANLGSGLDLYSKSLNPDNFPDEPGTSSSTYIKQAFEELANNLPTAETIATISACAQGGGTDMTSFALGLTAIGNAVESFNDSVINVDDDKVSNAANFLGIIALLQAGLPRNGSIFECFTGKRQTLAEFSVDIVTLGGAIGSFSESVKDIDEDKVTSATNAVSVLSEIQSGLDNTGGIDTFFTGEKDLADFGTNLNALGSALHGFSQNVAGIDAEQMSKVTAPVDALVDIQSKLDETGGMAQWFSGEKNLGTFGSHLVAFGYNLSTFTNQIGGVTISENMPEIMDMIGTFADIAERMSEVQYAFDLSDYIRWIGDDLKTFFDTVAGLDTSSHETLSTFINGIADAAVKLQGVHVDEWALTNLLEALTLPELPENADSYTGAAQKIPMALNAIILAIIAKEADFKSAGTTLGAALAKAMVLGIQNGTFVTTVASAGLSYAGSAAARRTVGSWKTTGHNLAMGLANGILAMSWRVNNAAIAVASAALTAIRGIWAIHSPSRVAAGLGENFDIGLAGGLDARAGVVFASAEKLGDGAVWSMQKSINIISELIASGIDEQPRIRPVLDMSDVTSGFRTIDGMFGASRSIDGYFNGTTAIGRVNEMEIDRGRIVGASDNRDVVEELRELATRFDALSGAVENMQLVLDTGALVGHTSSKMDRQLGVIAGRRERGN